LWNDDANYGLANSSDLPMNFGRLPMSTASPPRLTGATHILLVEDDAELSEMVGDVLTDNGFTTSTATTVSEMDAILTRCNVDLVVLDIMLPNDDGRSVCRRLRAVSNVPIIMLTALKEEIDCIVGLEIGADDYVTKPFNSRELVARIRAVLRRANNDLTLPGRRSRPLRFGG
jgi:two-component system OmpR family response regulator